MIATIVDIYFYFLKLEWVQIQSWQKLLLYEYGI